MRRLALILAALIALLLLDVALLSAVTPKAAADSGVPAIRLADEDFQPWPGPTERVVPVPVSPSPTATTPLVIASWYRDPNRPADALYAAMPGVRWGSPVRFVAVCSYLGGTTRCITVPVVDYCECPSGRAIDLSPAAMASLADLGLGLVKVSLEVLR